MLERVLLGNTGLNVSKIVFGSLTISPLGLGLRSDECRELLKYAFSRGINMIDTAEYYENYRQIAGVLPDCDFLIATKTYAFDRDGARASIERAKSELGRDFIDVFLLHEQESEHTIRGHREALDELYRAKALGEIGAVGLSTHHISGVYGAISARLDVVHPLINVSGLGICDGGREDMEAAIDAAFSAGLGVYSMKAIGGGNLFMRARECLDYAFSLKSAHAVAIGMRSIEEIDANLRFLKHGDFGKNFSPAVKTLHIENYCTGCGKCAARCSQNAIEIVDNMAKCDENRCLLCGYCAGVCPDFAIKMI